MNITNENVKEYIERKGRAMHWVLKKAKINIDDMEAFLNGKENDEIVGKIEYIFGEQSGFFKYNYVTPKSIEEQLEEIRKEQEKEQKEIKKRYEEKKKQLMQEVERILDIFAYAYYDEEDNEIVLNRENTVYISLGQMETEKDVMTVENLRYKVGRALLRVVIKGAEGFMYLAQLNEYLDEDIKMDEMKRYYEEYKHKKEEEKKWEIHAFMNRQLDITRRGL